jgi:hypothetical protein
MVNLDPVRPGLLPDESEQDLFVARALVAVGLDTNDVLC